MCEQYSVSQAIPPSGLWDRNNFRSARNAGGISRGLGLARPRPNLYSRARVYWLSAPGLCYEEGFKSKLLLGGTYASKDRTSGI
jgi:hypothetical protein